MGRSYITNYIKALKSPLPEIQKSFEAEFNFLKSNLKSNSVVLDVGCGIGRPAVDLAPFTNKIIGIDIENKMLDYAEKRAKGITNIKFQNGNAVEINYPAQTFDLVYSTYNFLGWDIRERNRQKVINEMVRVTKHEGMIINITWKNDNATTKVLKKYYQSIGIKIIKINNSRIITSKNICDRISRDEFSKLYKLAGLKQIKFYDIGPVWLAAIGIK